jgi:hypothetical protein
VLSGVFFGANTRGGLEGSVPQKPLLPDGMLDNAALTRRDCSYECDDGEKYAHAASRMSCLRPGPASAEGMIGPASDGQACADGGPCRVQAESLLSFLHTPLLFAPVCHDIREH